MKHTHEQLGDIINTHSMLNTTAETLSYLRRGNTDAFILDSLQYCSKGNALALHSLISKVPTRYRQTLERPELENEDIIQEMRGKS